MSDKNPFDNIPDDILRKILFLSADSPSQLVDLTTVSHRWSREFNTIVQNQPRVFRPILELPKAERRVPSNRWYHLHIGDYVLKYTDKQKELYGQVAPDLDCLSIVICPQSIPLLKHHYKQLRQLIIVPLNNGSAEGCTEWIPQPTIVQTHPWFPNLCSLHLLAPYNPIITSLSVTPSLPPHLTKLCIEFGPDQLKDIHVPFCHLLRRLAGSLETLTILFDMTSNIVVQQETIILDNLKELCLGVHGPDHQPPFILETPNLVTLMDFHAERPPVLPSRPGQVKTLLIQGDTFTGANYASLLSLEVLHIHVGHLESVKEYLNEATGHFSKLVTIVCYGLLQDNEEEWRSDGGRIILIIPKRIYTGIVFVKPDWLCNGCSQPHEH